MKKIKISLLSVFLVLPGIFVQSPTYAQKQSDRIGEMGIFYEGRSFETVYQDILDNPDAVSDFIGSIETIFGENLIPKIDVDSLSDLGNVQYPVMILNPQDRQFEIELLSFDKLIDFISDPDFEEFNSYSNRSLTKLIANVLDDVTNADFADTQFLANFLRYFDMGLFPYDETVSPEEDPLSMFNGIAGESLSNFIHNIIAELINPSLILNLSASSQPLIPFRYRPGKIVHFEREDNGSGFIYVKDVLKEYYSPITYRLFKRQFRDWQITIKEDGFNVFDRGSVADPFPDLAALLTPTGGGAGPITIPGFILDPIDLRSVWSRDLVFKIHAFHTPVDDGESPIVVNSVVQREIYRTLDGDAEGTTIQTERSEVQRSDRIFGSNEASCIDIFAGKVDEKDTSSGALVPRAPRNTGELGVAGYCLGRCAFPAIINSY